MPSKMLQSALALLLVASGTLGVVEAAGPGLLAVGEGHTAGTHEVEVDLPPIVKKYRVPLVRPRRVARSTEGTLYVADWGAGSVLAVGEDSRATVIAGDLREPAGLAFDAVGNLYVSEHAGGMTAEGRIVRIASDGERAVFADGLTGPTGLAFDATGNLFVACFHDNTVARITPTGEVTTFATDIPAPSAIVVDADNLLYVCSSTEGIVYTVGPMGAVTPLARGLQAPSDMALDPAGHLIVANYGGTELSYVDPRGRIRRYATVPKGTIGHLFDPEGNMVLVNWDFHLLMKVVTVLTVPCPDCDRPIRVRLREKRRPAATEPAEDEPII